MSDLRTRWRRAAVLVSVLAGGVAADQLVKFVAERWLAGRPAIDLAAGIVRLQYVINEGAFLSFGAGLPPPLREGLFVGFVGLFVAAAAGFALLARELTCGELVALSLIVSGGAGNLLDRVALGGVRDYVSLGVGPVRTGIFNLADVLLVLGVLLLVPALFGGQSAAGESRGRTAGPGPR